MEDAAAGSPAPSTPELVPDADGYRRITLAAGVSLTEELITQLRAFPQPPSDLAALQAHCDTFAADDAVLVVSEQGEYDIELVALGGASVFATAQLFGPAESKDLDISTALRHPLFQSPGPICHGTTVQGARCNQRVAAGGATCGKHKEQGLEHVAAGTLPRSTTCAVCGQGVGEAHFWCLTCPRVAHLGCTQEVRSGPARDAFEEARSRASMLPGQCAHCARTHRSWLLATREFRSGQAPLPTATLRAPGSFTPAPRRRPPPQQGEQARDLPRPVVRPAAAS